MKIKKINLNKFVQICRKGTFILMVSASALTLKGCLKVDNPMVIISEDKEDLTPTIKPITPTPKPTPTSNPSLKPTAFPTPTLAPTPTPVPEIKTVRLMAVGDNLIHGSVYKSGLQADGTYNYDNFFENIKDELEVADIKVINQETVLVKDSNNYSGYPTFGSPYGIGEAIVDAGFNVVLHATNHSYDKGINGIKETLDFWDQYKDKVMVLGIHDSLEDSNQISIIEVNDIKIAMINYTYGLNGFKLPSDKSYLVDTLYDQKKVVADIKEAKKTADLVIVFPHWGTEYVYEETKYQREQAELMAEAGADLIIGTHPHVVEPLKVIKTSDEREVPVYYSLGNFISSQDKKPRMLGAMAEVTIKKEDGVTTIESNIKPLVTHNEGLKKEFTVYMLEDYTEELASKHRMNKEGLTLEYLKNLYDKIIKEDSVKVLSLKKLN